MSIWKALAIGFGAAAVLGGTVASGVASSIFQVFDTLVTAGREAAFKLALPASMQPYSELILEATSMYGVSPWLIAAVMWAESNAGDALTPPGPGGTGDFGARNVGVWKVADPSTGLPPDGGGWGRGLMQIDYGVHYNWVTSQPWDDARTNVMKGAELLAANIAAFSSRVILDSRYTNGETVATGNLVKTKLGVPTNSVFPDPRPLFGDALYSAALAAYNAGQLQVLQAVAAGFPAESVTFRKDYVTYMYQHVAQWTRAFGG